MVIIFTTSKLAKPNTAENVIDIVSFIKAEKLGTGKEMVDRLTYMVSIFEQDYLNFAKNLTLGMIFLAMHRST